MRMTFCGHFFVLTILLSFQTYKYYRQSRVNVQYMFSWCGKNLSFVYQRDKILNRRPHRCTGMTSPSFYWPLQYMVVDKLTPEPWRRTGAGEPAACLGWSPAGVSTIPCSPSPSHLVSGPYWESWKRKEQIHRVKAALGKYFPFIGIHNREKSAVLSRWDPVALSVWRNWRLVVNILAID